MKFKAFCIALCLVMLTCRTAFPQTADIHLADLITVRTYNEDYQAMIDQGLLADLSQSPEIEADFRRLRPVFQSALRSAEGKIYGMPVLAGMYDCMYWLPESWEAFGAGKAPDSYTALLDLLEAFSGQPQAGFRVFPEAELMDGMTHGRRLLNALIGIWNAQAQYQGQAARFDDPAFAALAARAVEIGSALDQIPWDKGARALFSARYCRGMTLNGAFVTLDNLIPARIDQTQEKLMLFGVDLVCARDKDVIPSAAQIGDAQPEWAKTLLYADVSPEAWNAAHPQYRITEAWLDSLDTCGYLPFLPRRIPFGSDLEALYQDALRGTISATEFAEQLDILAHTPFSERHQ